MHRTLLQGAARRVEAGERYTLYHTREYNTIILLPSTFMLVQRDRLPAAHRLSFVETTGSLSSGDHFIIPELL